MRRLKHVSMEKVAKAAEQKKVEAAEQASKPKVVAKEEKKEEEKKEEQDDDDEDDDEDEEEEKKEPATQAGKEELHSEYKIAEITGHRVNKKKKGYYIVSLDCGEEDSVQV